MPFKGLDELPGARVPDTERVIPTRARQTGPSGIKAHVIDRPLVAPKNLYDFSCLCIPQSHKFVLTPRCEYFSVGAESDVLNSPLISCECQDRFPGV